MHHIIDFSFLHGIGFTYGDQLEILMELIIWDR